MRSSVNPELLKAYGTAQRDSRDAADLSQEALLKKAAARGQKIPQRRHLSSLENGHQEPGLEALFNVARALDLRPSQLIAKVEDMMLPPSERERIDRISAARVRIGFDTCKNCKTVYTVYVEQSKAQERGHYNCRRCKVELATWNAPARFIYETKYRSKGKRSR